MIPETTTLGGVYLIRNLRTGDTYVGGTANLEKRKNRHLFLLRRGYHFNVKLQEAFANFNAEEFEFSTLEEIKTSAGAKEIRKVESEWIKKLNPSCNGAKRFNPDSNPVGRPNGSGSYGAMLRLAISPVSLEWLDRWAARSNCATRSEAARRIIDERPEFDRLYRELDDAWAVIGGKSTAILSKDGPKLADAIRKFLNG